MKWMSRVAPTVKLVGASWMATMMLVGGHAAAAEQGDDKARAEAIFASMAKRLADTPALTVKVVRELDPPLARQTGMPERASIDVSLMRPNHLRARSVAPNNVRLFIADGKRVTVLDETANVYATVPAAGSIDEMSQRIEERFGFAPPIGELLSNDPQRAIGSRARSMSYRGEQQVNGHRCHRLMLTGDEADAELLVSVQDELPCRLIVRFKDGEGSKLRMTFSSWTLGAAIDESEFALRLPKGAYEVAMIPVEQLEPPGGKEGAAATPAAKPVQAPQGSQGSKGAQQQMEPRRTP